MREVRVQCVVAWNAGKYAVVERHFGSQSPKVAEFLFGAQHAGAASSNS